MGHPRRRQGLPARRAGRRVPPPARLDRHGRDRRPRVTLLLDSYAHITIGSLFGLGPHLSVTLGAIAFWLAIGLPLSFRLRQAKFISYRVWRKIHWAGYVTWVVMLLHGFFNGTDTGSPYAAALYAGSVALVGTAVLWRHFDDEPASSPARTSPARAE